MFKDVWEESKRCLTTKYFDFNGRARRREFWGFNVLLIAVVHVYVFLTALTTGEPAYEGDHGFTTASFIVLGGMGIFTLYIIIPLLSVSSRRLHDTGSSAWLLLLPSLLVVGFFVLAVMDSLFYSQSFGVVYAFLMIGVVVAFILNMLFMAFKGEPGKNKYGESPKPHFVNKPTFIGDYKFDFKQTLFERYAQFDGRARREEFWMFNLYYLGASVVLTVGATVLTFIGLEPIGLLIVNLFYAFMAIPSFAVLSRRLHDTSHSLWWYFLLLIPIVGFIIILIWLSSDGERYKNAYGHDQKSMTKEVVDDNSDVI